MAITINASTSSGLVQTADTSGTIQLQSAGATKLTVSSSGTSIAQYSPAASLITSGTSQTASGTAVIFSSIPSWAKRITIMFDNVIFATSDRMQIQLVTSGGTVATGYNSGCWLANTTNVTSTTGFPIVGFAYNTVYFSGIATISLLNASSNIWAENSVLSSSTGSGYTTHSGGSVTLSSVLTGIRISGVSGNSFGSGNINILYE